MDLSPWLKDSTLFDLYSQEALSELGKLLCFNPLDHGSGKEFYGIVSGDYVTVQLPYWVASVSEVMLNSLPLAFSFQPTTGDAQTGDSTPKEYGRYLTLSSPQREGTVVVVTGDYGFVELPDSLKALLAAIINGIDQRLSGTDYVKSKSIEDVSETRADIVSESTPLELIGQVYSATISKWSLCGSEITSGLGRLSFPHKLFNPPWWLTPADIGRIGR